MDQRIFDQLLYLYDYHIRCVAKLQTDNSDQTDSYYACGCADAIGQVILDLGKLHNEDIAKPHRFEAYTRVMQFTNAAKYVQDYPVPVQRPALAL